MLPFVAGAIATAHSARSEASKNRAFQIGMSNTAYQRAANDLEKAGLNRILALGNAASTPSGNVSDVPDYAANLASGTQANAAKKHAQLAENKNEAEISLIRDQANAASASARQADAQARFADTNSNQLTSMLPYLQAESAARTAAANAQAGFNIASARQANAQAANLENIGKGTQKFGEGVDVITETTKKAPQTLLDFFTQDYDPNKPPEYPAHLKGQWQKMTIPERLEEVDKAFARRYLGKDAPAGVKRK